jgi:hypothetical protein
LEASVAGIKGIAAIDLIGIIRKFGAVSHDKYCGLALARRRNAARSLVLCHD